MRIPIACSLTVDDARDRGEEWRAFLGRAAAVERTDRRELRVRLPDTDQDLLAAVDLARREQDCCRFFQFSVDVTAEACWLVARVPSDDAAAVLDDMAALVAGRAPA